MEEKCQAVPLKSVMKEEWCLSPFLFSTVLTALAGAVKLEKVIKRGQKWKEEAKLSCFADGMTLYFNGPKILSENFKKLFFFI